jgi:outer membrane protein, multidrug efflux system
MKARLPLLLSLLLCGCTVGPNYTMPNLQTPPGFGELPRSAKDAPLSLPLASQADLSQWWKQIPDPELQSLIEEALRSNLDLMTAASRVREAREQEIIAGAPGLPQIDANAVGAHVHSGSNPLAGLLGGSSGGSSGGSGGSGSRQSGGIDTDLYSLGFDATWEIDVFGRIRRGVEAARANTESAVWQMRDGEVSLTAEVANDYLTLRSIQARIAVINAQVSAERGVVNLVSARARAGFVTQLDVNQQVTLAQNTAAEIPELEAQIRAQEHAIAILLARAPEAMTAELDRTAPLPPFPATLPVGLPSDLLRRRPDIREAERKLAAATAQEGEAIAELYPRFNLLGLASIASPAIGSLFSTSNLTEAGAGQITWTLFKGGELRANIRAREEEERQAYFAYQSAVLAAIRDAEDALVRYEKEQTRFVDLKAAAATAQSSVSLAEQQYRVGLTTYVDVLTAQTNLQTAQDALVQSRQLLAQNLIALYKALGGGWQEHVPAETEKP